MSNEEKQKLAEQHGFVFAACLICSHKQGCPSNDYCNQCIEDTKNHESQIINYRPT